GLTDSVTALIAEIRREFGEMVRREYAEWVAAAAGDPSGKYARDGARPPLSVDVVERHIGPRVGHGPLLFMIIDCLRLDQWRMLRPLLAGDFELSEELYCSILPT